MAGEVQVPSNGVTTSPAAATPPPQVPAAAPPSPPPGPSGSPPAATHATPPAQAPAAATQAGAIPPAQAGATQSGAATPPAPAGPPGWVKALRDAGVPVPDVDEGAATRILAEQYKRAQEMSRYAPQLQQYLAQQQQFEAWQRQQQAAAQQPQDQKPWYQPWWQPPEFDQSWRQYVTTDEQGNVVERPGAPAGVAAKYTQYMGWRQQQAEKFLSNPFEFIQQPVQHIAAAVAQQMIQQHLGGYQEQVQTQQIIQKNADWIYQRDAGGSFVQDPLSGQRVLSAWGQKYGEYVAQAAKMGVREATQQHDYALGLVQRDYLMGQQQNASAAQTNDQLKQQFLQQGNAPNAGAVTAPPATPGAATPPQPGLSLADRMRTNLRGVSVTSN